MQLSVNTLRPARVVNNMVSKLRINCDYASRGCSESTVLEGLETHVATCGYAPVFCSNEECGMKINKQDKVSHESKVCKYRRVRYHDFQRIHDDVGTLNGKVEKALTGKDVEELKVMMNQVFEKMTLLEMLKKRPGIRSIPRGRDILIAGGYRVLRSDRSVEIFSSEKNCWIEVTSMHKSHATASVFIYDTVRDSFMIGGLTKTIETLKTLWRNAIYVC